MNISIKLDYRGSSKILKRLCQCINYLSEHANGDMLKEVYDQDGDGIVDNSALTNGFEVNKDVPADALFTDTVYDDSYVRGRVQANANNITLIMETLFDSDVHYLMDSSGQYILDSRGNKIITARYRSKLAEIQAAIYELQRLGLSVRDGKIQQTIQQ